jgi:hypothetical protein
MKRYNVDVVEVIGNTDERPVTPPDGVAINSNLDFTLLSALRGELDVSQIVSADNTDLGLARAVAVTRELKANPLLAGRTIIPLSAAQLVDLSGRLTDGTQSGDVEARRRIEIRLRHSDSGP